jgi:hypothetical protein
MIYRNSKGKFISKDEWLSLQPKENKKTMNNSRRRKPTQPAAELNAEQVTSKSEIAEGTQVVEVGADFDLDAYKERVAAFEKHMEEYNINSIEEEIVEEEPTKTPGFFTTWFKKWIF